MQTGVHELTRSQSNVGHIIAQGILGQTATRPSKRGKHQIRPYKLSAEQVATVNICTSVQRILILIMLQSVSYEAKSSSLFTILKRHRNVKCFLSDHNSVACF